MSGKYLHQGEVGSEELYDIMSITDGLKLVKRQKVKFTHKLALDLLELEEFAGDRNLKQGHVNYLVQCMIRGTFHCEWVSLITCKLNGKIYRMNGQHTAWAVLEMKKSWACQVDMLEYVAKSEHDMRMLYASIDRSSPRTKTNVIQSYLAGSEEFKGAKGSSLKIAPSGFTHWFWATKTDRRKHDGDTIAYLLKTDHYDLVMKVIGFLDKLSSKNHAHVFRASVVGAMFATFAKAPLIAIEFWTPVADGVGITKRGDPRLKLRTWLLQTSVGDGAGGRSGKQKVSSEHMFRQCIACWNAFRENRTMQILRANDSGKRTRVK